MLLSKKIHHEEHTELRYSEQEDTKKNYKLDREKTTR